MSLIRRFREPASGRKHLRSLPSIHPVPLTRLCAGKQSCCNPIDPTGPYPTRHLSFARPSSSIEPFSLVQVPRHPSTSWILLENTLAKAFRNESIHPDNFTRAMFRLFEVDRNFGSPTTAGNLLAFFLKKTKMDVYPFHYRWKIVKDSVGLIF